MTDYVSISPDDADKLAIDVVSRLPPAICSTDDERARLTASLSSFFARCARVAPPVQDSPDDQNGSTDH